MLIPVHYLVNGGTIVQQPRDFITYWHIELAEHSLICAEGLPAESYLDTGNRSALWPHLSAHYALARSRRRRSRRPPPGSSSARS